MNQEKVKENIFRNQPTEALQVLGKVLGMPVGLGEPVAREVPYCGAMQTAYEFPIRTKEAVEGTSVVIDNGHSAIYEETRKTPVYGTFTAVVNAEGEILQVTYRQHKFYLNGGKSVMPRDEFFHLSRN